MKLLRIGAVIIGLNKGFASEINNILHIKDYRDCAIAFLKNTDAKKYLTSKFPSEL